MILEGSTPLAYASLIKFSLASAGYSKIHSTESGTLFIMFIHTVKVLGSNLYSWLKLAKINLSSGRPYLDLVDL
jgi:hypothetical protein